MPARVTTMTVVVRDDGRSELYLKTDQVLFSQLRIDNLQSAGDSVSDIYAAAVELIEVDRARAWRWLEVICGHPGE